MGIEIVYVVIVGAFLNPIYNYHVVHPKLIKESYISEIKGDFFQVNLAKKHLDNFNELGHNKIVKFEGGTRPITIEIRTLNQGFYEQIRGPEILAYAEYKKDSCKIVMRDTLYTEIQFRNTLFHELLHCYFYDHSPDQNDLMYYQENLVTEENIKKYAEEVERRISD